MKSRAKGRALADAFLDIYGREIFQSSERNFTPPGSESLGDGTRGAEAAAVTEPSPSSGPEVGKGAKLCSCGEQYDAESWLALRPRGYQGARMSGSVWRALELRDCRRCGSTIAVPIVWTPNAFEEE